MPLFQCSKCGCAESTSGCHYWSRGTKEPLCSECDPEVGLWHNMFPKEDAKAKGYKVGSDGFLYHAKEIESGSLAWRMQHHGLTFKED